MTDGGYTRKQAWAMHSEIPRDIPVIFSAPMIRALIEGRKTQTRRLARLPMRLPKSGRTQPISKWRPDGERPSPWQKVKPGDRLWVREALRCQMVGWPLYCADDMEAVGLRWRWKRSRLAAFHCPRWASRLTLIVTAAKIERLLDISEADARAEGFADGKIDDGFGPRDIGDGWTVESPGGWASAAGHFQILWSQLHSDWDGYSSPEVVALTFRVVKANIDSPSPTLSEEEKR